MIYFAGLAIVVAFIAVGACGCGVGQGIALYGATTSKAALKWPGKSSSLCLLVWHSSNR